MAVFALDLGREAFPDRFLALRLEGAAEGRGPAARGFLEALAAVVRNGDGSADASGLDAAGRAEVLAALVSLHEAARRGGDPRALDLMRVRAQWETFASHQDRAHERSPGLS